MVRFREVVMMMAMQLVIMMPLMGAGHAGFAYTHQNAEQHDDADRAHQIGLFGGKH